MQYSFDTKTLITNKLHTLALAEFNYVSHLSEYCSMDYFKHANKTRFMLATSPMWGGWEIAKSMKDLPSCNLQGFRPRPEFESAVLDELPIIKKINRKFWIRLQTLNNGYWFPYHTDEVKTGGLFIGLQHHNEKTRFWSERKHTPIPAKALSNLHFEQEICVKDREVWIFDHSSVHSVHDCTPTTPRITMTIAFEGLRPQDLTQFFL